MSRLFTSITFRDTGTLIGPALISVVFASMSPTFLTRPNLLNVLQQSSINARIALGMTLVIPSGGIDLSVGPVAALTAILGAAMMVAIVPIPLALLSALAAGAARCFVNGAPIAWGGLQSFIVTLGGLSLYRVLALIYTRGQPIFGLPNDFRALTNRTLGSAPTPVIIVGVLAVVAWVILNKTPVGEYFMAIAASATGGASLMGGRGSIPGTLIGCIIPGTRRDGLTLLNVQAFYQLLATGIIIIVAMLTDKFASGADGGKQG